MLLAVTLLASALLKLSDPFPAMHALAWTGAGDAGRLATIVGMSVVEAVLGAALAVGLWCKPVLWSSAALALSLAAGHAGTSILGDGSACGCFGAVEVPEALVYAVLGLGAASCLRCARQSMQPCVPRLATWQRTVIASVLVAAATHPLVGGESLAAEATPSEVLAALGSAEPGADEILMIGSWACVHCREAIEEIEKQREDELRDDLVLHLVQRRSDRAAANGVARSWIREHRIADRLWWAGGR